MHEQTVACVHGSDKITTMNNPDTDSTARLDAKGLNCPLPILKTKVELNRLQPGDLLRVEATDPHSRVDFEAYCARTGHSIENYTEVDGVFTFYIRRAENPNPA
ncbi:MAG: sulfurtransferase TusA family protein [Thiotrichales bacterium]|nr:sulfurtransferase TusA family protein [Thiotrichales bacterium]